MFTYYSTAPVMVWVFPKNDEEAALTKYAKGLDDANIVSFYEGEDKEAKAAAIVKAFELAQAKYDSLSNEKVKPLFEKYDADKSGFIDKEELGNLCSDLGRKLTSEELEAALKDLDLNGDGNIDFSEFKRWWFSGFKSYSGMKRSMIKAKKYASNAFDALMKNDI